MRAPARRIEIQQPFESSNHLLDLHKCLPFYPNSFIEEITFEIDFDLSRLNSDFQVIEDAEWTIKCYPKYVEILDALKVVNSNMRLRVSLYSNVHYNLKVNLIYFT